MNKNEIRGYIFMAFAVMCLAVYTLGDISSGYIRPSDILIVFLIFAPVFGFIAAYCFANAYAETKGTNILNMETMPTINRIGMSWTELNIFSSKVNKISVTLSEDKETLSCELYFTAENLQPQLKNGENNLCIRMNALCEQGKEKLELPLPNAFEITLEAGETKTQIYPFDVPADLERVLLEFTAEADSSDEVYTQTYAFYPKHYIR